MRITRALMSIRKLGLYIILIKNPSFYGSLDE
jgi:hypothetical protein